MSLFHPIIIFIGTEIAGRGSLKLLKGEGVI